LHKYEVGGALSPIFVVLPRFQRRGGGLQCKLETLYWKVVRGRGRMGGGQIFCMNGISKDLGRKIEHNFNITDSSFEGRPGHF